MKALVLDSRALSFKSGTYSGVFTLAPLLTGEGREHYGQILREATRLAHNQALRPLLDSHNFTLEMRWTPTRCSSNGRPVVSSWWK